MHYFFYGTLMAGSGNRVSDRIHARLFSLGPATTQGRLFAIPTPQGWYPALITDPDGGAVHGEAYRALPEWSAADLDLLDAYEAYYPDRPEESEYLRQPIGIRLAEGREEPADAYVYRAALPDGAVPVPCGNFRDFLADNRLPAYRVGAGEIESVLRRRPDR